MNDRFEMDFFGGYQWKTIGEIEAHLVAENRQRAAPGSVAFTLTLMDQGVE
jgi:hypothetical protein